jgi:hypothetical protein
MTERKKLADILLNSERDKIGRLWDSTPAADELKPIPNGEYKCRIVDGTLFASKSGTPGFKLSFEIAEGAYSGRRLWWDCWLSEAALSMAKRDLAKIGVVRLEQLERPIPEGLVATVKVALRRDDAGEEFNRVARFEIIGIERPEPEPFAPPSDDEFEASTTGDDESLHCNQNRDPDGFDWRTGKQEDPPTPRGGQGGKSRS